MRLRTTLFASLALAVAALSCSKTEDTAPERRLFGDPPTIKAVDFSHTEGTQEAPGFGPRTFISCDFTDIVIRSICELGGGPPYTSLQPLAGGGWTFDPVQQKGIVGDNPSAQPGIFIQGTYGEAIFKVSATDPNSTTAQDNILLVSASYQEPDSATETSLVLFDDGAFNKFKNAQKQPTPGEDCTINADSTCTCNLAQWDVTSGDITARDDVWTRKIAFIGPNTHPFLKDCIMRDRQETLVNAPKSTTFTFKIEAVDRQGNLVTWPNKLVGVTDSGDNDFGCNGDSCGCCILWFQTTAPECHALPGLVSPDFPDGLCNTF